MARKVVHDLFERICEIEFLEYTIIVPKYSRRGNVVERISIKDGDRGRSYESLFGIYLTSDITEVQLDEPYLCKNHQLSNLVRFCELLVLKCPKLSLISVTTKPLKELKKKAEQYSALRELTQSLLAISSNRIKLEIEYSKTLHDRHIT